MISNFVRDNSYFQSLFENNFSITSNDIDNELNNIITFLNKKVIIAINNISINGYVGVENNVNYILKNTETGELVFEKLRDINYKNNSISLNKIKGHHRSSLLVNFPMINAKIYYQGNYFFHTEAKRKVISYFLDGNNPYGLNLSYIKDRNFYNKSIKSNNIEVNAIKKEHLTKEAKLYLLKNIVIGNSQIINNTVYSTKFAPRSISYNKLHSNIKIAREQLNILIPKTKIVTTDLLKENSFDITNFSKLSIFKKGFLDKSVIPINSINISKPDNKVPDTIDTFQLNIYSVSRWTKLKRTYTVETNVHIASDAENTDVGKSEKLVEQYNDLKLYELSLADIYFNRCFFTPTPNMDSNKIRAKHYFLEGEISELFYNYPDIKNMLLRAAKDYNNQLQKAIEYAYLAYFELNNLELMRNRISRVPPGTYLVWEKVPKAKYFLHKKQDVIKSRHLKDGMFNISNIPYILSHGNVSRDKFINKTKLSSEVRSILKLG